MWRGEQLVKRYQFSVCLCFRLAEGMGVVPEIDVGAGKLFHFSFNKGLQYFPVEPVSCIAAEKAIVPFLVRFNELPVVEEQPFKVVFMRGDEILAEWLVDSQEEGEEQLLEAIRELGANDDEDEDDDEEEDDDDDDEDDDDDKSSKRR